MSRQNLRMSTADAVTKSPPGNRRLQSRSCSMILTTMSLDQTAPDVFLSYASEDVERVETLYHQLQAGGLRPWMDRIDIHAGERWEQAIWRAIRDAAFFVVCISQNSVTKRGVLQKELKQALRQWEEKLDDDIYVIPVRLEPCKPPDTLAKFQWVDLFSQDGLSKLLQAIQEGKHRSQQVRRSPWSEHSQMSMATKTRSDRGEGRISYQLEVEYPEFVGPEMDALIEINSRVAGTAIALLMDSRKAAVGMLDEEYGLSPIIARNDLSVTYVTTLLSDRLISVHLIESGYHAGAAHPYSCSHTLNFQLLPTIPLELGDLFPAEIQHEEELARLCALDLQAQARADNVREAEDLEKLRSGVSELLKKRPKFVLTPDHLRLIFDAYDVGSYAWGRRFVELPYRRLRTMTAFFDEVNLI